jgi:hypothetical protein
VYRLASAVLDDATTTAKRAAATLHRSPRDALKSADEVNARAETVIFLAFWMRREASGYWLSTAAPVRGSSLPFCSGSGISRPFIARLIKGCRVDARAD